MIQCRTLSSESNNNIRYKNERALLLDTNSVFITLFSIMPLVDSLNGYLLRSGFSTTISVGDLYRITVILVMFIFLFKRVSHSITFVLSVAVAYGLVSVLIHNTLIHPEKINIFSEINLLIQWMLSPLIIFSIITAVDLGTINRVSLEKTLNNLQWIAPLTILIPYALGLGYSTYHAAEDELIGFKAFYYATNGISFMLIALFARAVYLFLSNKTKLNFAAVIINGVALALIGTKSTLAMLVAAFFIATYCIYGNRLLRLLGGFALLTALMLVVWLFASDEILSFLSPILGRWDYFSSSVYQGDILSALTSGRIDQIGVHWAELYSNNFSAFALFVGLGDLSSFIRICEMDFFDAFFQFGIIGLSGLLAYLVFILKCARRYSEPRGFELCMIYFFIVYAFIVGHVFNNALSSMVFALFAVVAMTRNDLENRRTNGRAENYGEKISS